MKRARTTAPIVMREPWGDDTFVQRRVEGRIVLSSHDIGLQSETLFCEIEEFGDFAGKRPLLMSAAPAMRNLDVLATVCTAPEVYSLCATQSSVFFAQALLGKALDYIVYPGHPSVFEGYNVCDIDVSVYRADDVAIERFTENVRELCCRRNMGKVEGGIGIWVSGEHPKDVLNSVWLGKLVRGLRREGYNQLYLLGNSGTRFGLDGVPSVIGRLGDAFSVVSFCTGLDLLIAVDSLIARLAALCGLSPIILQGAYVEPVRGAKILTGRDCSESCRTCPEPSCVRLASIKTEDCVKNVSEYFSDVINKAVEDKYWVSE